MADKKKNEEMVTIRVPLKGKEDTLFVGVNFKNYLLKRGQYVTIPKSVYEVLMNSTLAEEFIDNRVREMEADYLRKAANPLESVQ